MTGRKILFVNTYLPVVPIYEDSFPRMQRYGISPVALVSEGHYRDTNRTGNSVTKRTVRVPRFLRSNKRAVAVIYWLTAPFELMFGGYHEIVMLTQPPLFYGLGATLAMLVGKPYTIHVMDLYPDLLSTSGSRLSNLVGTAFKPISRYALRNARQVIVIGRCMKTRLLAAGVCEDRIVTVPNWPNVSLGNSIATGERFRNRFSLGRRFLVMYSGNMGNFHSFGGLLAAARKYAHEGGVAFVFIGKGSRRREVTAASKTLDNIIVLDHQADSEFPDVLAAGNLHFVSLREGFEGLLVPSKFYGILASGRPILYEGSRDGEVARVIAENRIGVVVAPGESIAIESAIDLYCRDPNLCREHGANARRLYEEQYERTMLAERYASLFATGLKEGD